ncbi:9144_t:CDS:2 [Gigaspora margarita]|uniref:9144_t:CDS:1 n=1 Tax=Gigaspora margarita TaxID=4874 RepID=A0ABM8VZ04_GIGMA|nr:9144_t:CDS:2 [Gigaspora margarita]
MSASGEVVPEIKTLNTQITNLLKENATFTDTITTSNKNTEDILNNLDINFTANDTLTDKLNKIVTASKEISEIK